MRLKYTLCRVYFFSFFFFFFFLALLTLQCLGFFYFILFFPEKVVKRNKKVKIDLQFQNRLILFVSLLVFFFFFFIVLRGCENEVVLDFSNKPL